MKKVETISDSLSSSLLRKLIEVSLACTEYYEVNLYNEAGIPARPGKIVIK